MLVAAAFFVRKPGSPTNQILNKEGSTTQFTGKISGLPLTVGDKGAILNIVDPTNALLISGKEIERGAVSYQIETSPGWRMVILKAWDFDSQKVYIGSSRIVNVSQGQTQEADIILREAATFSETSSMHTDLAHFNLLQILSESLIAYAAEKGPVFAVIARKPEPGEPIVNPGLLDTIGISLAKAGQNAGHSVVITDPEFLGQVEEERNLKELPPGTYGDFTPSEPNFAVEVEYRRHELRDPIVIISIRNLENGEVFWQETTDSRIDTQTNYEMHKVYELAAKKLVESVVGKGPNPIKLPAFTPSVPKPVSMTEWRARLKKLLGLDKQGWATGNVKTTSPTAVPKQTCNFDGFVACRDQFNLQGCIDACPYVPTTCPPGTPPGTDCKQTDQDCSGACWDRGNTHGAGCAKDNNCTPKEIDTRLRQMSP